jgi:DNA-binding MarR family transcriptional regulator
MPLAQLLVRAQQWVNLGVVQLMRERGHARLSAAQLAFLSNLDCGWTHAAAVARRMGVTRQAVYRQTRELQALGILALEDDPERGNQRIIRITPRGTVVIDDARACVAEVEAELARRIGDRTSDQLRRALSLDWGPTIEG